MHEKDEKAEKDEKDQTQCLNQSEPHWANDVFALEWILQLLREAFTEELEHAVLITNPNGRLLKIPIVGFWYFETAPIKYKKSSWMSPRLSESTACFEGIQKCKQK